MISCKRSIRLLAFLILAAAGLSLVSGCGDDDAVTNPDPEDPPKVTIQIVAIIASVSDGSNLLGGNIEVGNNITGTYTYDPAAVDENASATVGQYMHDSPPYGIFLDINGYVFKTDLSDVNFLVGLSDNHGTPPKDHYQLISYNNAEVLLNVSVGSISWQLDDPNAVKLTSTELTTEPPVLVGWTSDFGLTITGSHTTDSMRTYSIRAHVTEIAKVE